MFVKRHRFYVKLIIIIIYNILKKARRASRFILFIFTTPQRLHTIHTIYVKDVSFHFFKTNNDFNFEDKNFYKRGRMASQESQSFFC